MLFFEAEVLGVDELPYRPVINLQSALGELGDQAAQGEISLGPFQHKDTMIARNRLLPVAAHLARRHATGLSLPSHPSDGCADRNPELLGRPIAGQPASQNRGNYPLAKIQ
jgi:hypothetical protein